MSEPQKEIVKFEGKEIELYYFGNPMFHCDWHKAEEMGLVYIAYNHYGPDYWDDTLTFAKKEQQARAKERREKMTEEEKEKVARPIMEKYEEEASPYYSTARLWDDGILDPLETRKALALGIAMSLNAPIPDYKVGIFRM
jgi:hypothetical protein